ncbi:protein of unknown function [Desulfotomaculum arcticum]|uniref:DUF3786 domain-containing protein n=1 Tax=Desulfotruncus arcticus DSM 17038 TaxID=1121424 RepID=A0A1I2S3U6_9FIRM|nr:DUF3786 domain-containing protein [Desulfotruncus arcticus]SFG44736.1 protein of unknown function [Desulfotomaculum arcticum] [Desulfotruncus arcticus DSM 17038]
MCNELTAHSAAVNDFINSNLEEIILTSGAFFSKDHNHLIIDYYNRKHYVSVQSGEVTTASGDQVALNDATLILQYIIQCSGLPPRGRWISFLELPDGIHHYVPFLNDACNPISREFGNQPEKLLARSKLLGGIPASLGDCSVIIPAFPKLPLVVVMWEGDDEFPPKATILFDAIAPQQLSTAALWVLGCELTKKLIS